MLARRQPTACKDAAGKSLTACRIGGTCDRNGNEPYAAEGASFVSIRRRVGPRVGRCGW